MMTKICLWLGVVLTLSALIGNKAVNAGKPATCTAEFDAMTTKSTMCLVDSPKVVRTGVSEADKQTILRFHNERRATTDPVATDVFKLIWDEKLAEVAQKLSQQCRMFHDQNRRVPSYPGLDIGQNLAAGYDSWETVMSGWYDEKSRFTYGQQPANWKQVAHYTQMVSKKSYRIGCGFSECRGAAQKYFWACNYANIQYDIKKPYTTGTTRCSACPNNCNAGLCDCGGLLCLNAGTLDKNTCTCKCPGIYTGRDCGTLSCPSKDKGHCVTQWPKSFCTKYYNVPADCPYMCGICKK